MSVPEDQFDEFDETPPEPAPKSSKLREALERTQAENAQLREQVAENEKLRNENTLYKANLGNLNEDQQKAVLATSAEMTADALRSQAEKLGFVEPPAPAAPPEDLEVFDRVADAVAGGLPADGGGYDAELAAARDEDEMLAVMRKYNKPIKL